MRITPANAGKKTPPTAAVLRSRDHPRICGDKFPMRCARKRQTGSPPHMRGKEVQFEHARVGSGITPACAGKSSRPAAASRRSWDHPRVCGEKPSSSHTSRCFLGSPPRMRGKGSTRGCGTMSDRITPAYAGKRLLRLHALPVLQDHPRVCGEKRNLCWLERYIQGSPPRMRGKAGRTGQCCQLLGITPAYAGKRQQSFWLLTIATDHPRVCGEKQRRKTLTAIT